MSITFQHLHGLSCGSSAGDIKVTDHAFGDVLLAKLLEVLLMALEVLNEKAEPLALQFWAKINVQSFGGLLESTAQSLHGCGEDVEVTKRLTYLGSVMHNDGGSHQEVT